MVNVVYAIIATQVDGLVDRFKVLTELNRVLAQIPDKLFGPDPEKWGTTPEAQAGMAAAEALVAGRIAVP